MELTREERKRIMKKKRKRRNAILFCMTLLLIAMTGCCIFLLYSYKQEKNKAIQAMNQRALLEGEMQSGDYISKKEMEDLLEKAKMETEDEYLRRMRTMMENGDGTLTLLETFYPDKIVVPDSKRYYFFDIDETLKKNSYKKENFVFPELNKETNEYEGEASYSENGELVSHKGIDVSKFQGDINWEKVAKDGVEFAYIRLGYRGYESGKIVTDEKYENNIKGCNEAGIDTGVYFFTEAKTKAEGREEAEFVLEELEGYRIDLPIVIDVEQSAKENSRTKNLTAEERTEAVIAFCERIKEAGHQPMIYGNLKSLMLMLDMSKLEEYDKWFAYYHYPVIFPYQYRVWQYTASGDVDGIKGDTDMNIAFY